MHVAGESGNDRNHGLGDVPWWSVLGDPRLEEGANLDVVRGPVAL